MHNFNEYINYINDRIVYQSEKTYENEIFSSSVIFSFDFNNLISEACFARLYPQMVGVKEFSSNYLLRLPYIYSDKNNELHSYYVNYPVFFEQLQKLVEDTYKITVYDTSYVNIKLVTMKNIIKLPIDLDYCLTLILFTMIRGVEGESIKSLKANFKVKDSLGENLVEYIYSLSRLNRGSHHNINDCLDNLIRNTAISEEFKMKVFNNFINTLQITFGKDGLIKNPEYKEYFKKYFHCNPKGYGYAMQTKSYDYINMTTNKILTESS